MRYCVDASYVLALLLPFPKREAAITRWNAIRPADDVLAPLWFLAECTSVLSESAYRKEVPAQHARELVRTVLRMPVVLVHVNEYYPRAFDIAHTLGWANVYDALYLAAAEHEDAELLTVDRGMREAARRLGIRASLIA